MPKYAVTDKDGKVVTITNATHALESTWVVITDKTIESGDVIHKDTGTVVNKKPVDNQDSLKKGLENVRQALRSSDWTQISDNLDNKKQEAWFNYRKDIRTAWEAAKITEDPFGNMVWPVAPGDEFDGLA